MSSDPIPRTVEKIAHRGRESQKMQVYRDGLSKLYPFLKVGDLKFWSFVQKYTILTILFSFFLAWAWIILKYSQLGSLINQAKVNNRPKVEIETISNERTSRTWPTIAATIFLLDVVTGLLHVNSDLIIYGFRIELSLVINYLATLLLNIYI